MPSESSATGRPSCSPQPRDRAVAPHVDATLGDALEEALGGQADRAFDDVLHLPRRHQPQLAQLELAHRHRAQPVEQPAARSVARAVEELLHPAQVQVAEERLAHPREQQHLEVEDARHLAGHLPQHLPGDHGGARGGRADRHGDVARRLAVADHQHVLAARVLGVVEVGARAEPPARHGELGHPGVLGHGGLAKHAVGHDQPVEPLGGAAEVELPAVVDRPGRVHLGGEHDVEGEALGVRREPPLHLLTRRPLGVVVGHREVRERVLGLRALRGEARVTAGRAPHAADVRGAVVHPHDVARLGEHLGGGEPGDARPDDRDAHRQPACGGIRSCRPKSAMISLIALMSGGPSGSSASAW